MLDAIRNIMFPRSKDLPVKAYVCWPTDPVTDTLVRRALGKISTKIIYASKDVTEKSEHRLLQWCSYARMDHELAHFYRDDSLSSSFAFRSSLVEKHHLQRSVQSYIAKNPQSVLAHAHPHSYEFEISFSDELDEMWSEELYAFGQKLEEGNSWWILKPLALGSHYALKIFRSKDELQYILEQFEQAEPDEEDETGTVSSQRQHFIVQEYVDKPLLLEGRKVQLKVFCLAKGHLQLYLYKHAVVYFASAPYADLDADEDAWDRDMAPHFTSPPRNPIDGNDVHLLQQLAGATIGSGEQRLTKDDIDSLMEQVRQSIAEVFMAVRGNPVRFQARSNAFELYAVDFIVSHESDISVKLVGIEAEPTFRFIGTKLDWALDEIFVGIAKIAVEPFFQNIAKDEGGSTQIQWKLGQERHGFVKFMEEENLGKTWMSERRIGVST